jgi:glycosyltransferase involved in cell wall biosynthesis
MTVSVVVPAHDAAGFVAGAIASVRAQGVEGVEVVVVDDGSTDGTAGVLAGQAGDDLVVVTQPNRGPAAARNRGLAEARGSLIAFLDADDEWPAGSLAGRVAHLEGHPEVDVVLGRTQFFGDVASAGVRFDGPDHTVLGSFLGSGLYRRGAFDADRAGRFDEELRSGEDYDWFLRAREAGLRIATTEQVTLRYRVHPGGMSRDVATGNRHLALALHRSLARRRSGAAGPAPPLPSLLRSCADRRSDPASTAASSDDEVGREQGRPTNDERPQRELRDGGPPAPPGG